MSSLGLASMRCRYFLVFQSSISPSDFVEVSGPCVIKQRDSDWSAAGISLAGGHGVSVQFLEYDILLQAPWVLGLTPLIALFCIISFAEQTALRFLALCQCRMGGLMTPRHTYPSEQRCWLELCTPEQATTSFAPATYRGCLFCHRTTHSRPSK